MTHLPRFVLALVGALAGAVAGAAGGCASSAPIAPRPPSEPALTELSEGSFTGLRVQWAVLDETGRVETWFEDLRPPGSASAGSLHWISHLRDEDGRCPSPPRQARFRRSALIAVWPLVAPSRAPELDTAFTPELPP